MTPSYWTLKEIAFEFKRSPETIRRWIAALKLPVCRPTTNSLFLTHETFAKLKASVETKPLCCLKSRPAPTNPAPRRAGPITAAQHRG